MSQEHIYNLCNVRHAAVTSSVHIIRCRWRPLAQYYLHGTLRSSSCIRVVCKPNTIEDHMLYHATVVSRCTRKCAYPRQQSFAICCGRRYALDGQTQKFKSALKHRPRVGWTRTQQQKVLLLFGSAVTQSHKHSSTTIK